MTVTESDAANWIRRFTPAEGTTRRIVCFPHAGGSASFFHPVSKRLAPRTDVVALQYPGRQDRRREPAISDIGSYADQIADVLRTLAPKPTVFFGHSMGAVLAFEVACRLDRRPGALVVSGRRGPSTDRRETVHLRDDNGVLEEIRKLNGTASAVLDDDEILRMALPSIRSDYRAIETYTCGPERTVDCPITVLVGDDDPTTTVEEAEVWRRHTTADYRLRVFSGGHFFLSECVDDVLKEIAGELDKLDPVCTGG